MEDQQQQVAKQIRDTLRTLKGPDRFNTGDIDGLGLYLAQVLGGRGGGSGIPSSQKGIPNGLATLDADGNVPLSQLGNVAAAGNTPQWVKYVVSYTDLQAIEDTTATLTLGQLPIGSSLQQVIVNLTADFVTPLGTLDLNLQIGTTSAPTLIAADFNMGTGTAIKQTNTLVTAINTDGAVVTAEADITATLTFTPPPVSTFADTTEGNLEIYILYTNLSAIT